MKTLTLRAFAKQLNVSHAAVSKAITTGRLSRSIVRDGRGQPRIRSFAAARREWAATTHPRGGAIDIREYRQAQTRRAQVRAELEQLQLEERRGRLIDATRAAERWTAAIVAARTRLLAIPTRLRTRHPEAGADLLHGLDELIREALEELASGHQAHVAAD